MKNLFFLTIILLQFCLNLNAQEKQTPDAFDGYKEFKFLSSSSNYNNYNKIKIKEDSNTIIYSFKPTHVESTFLETTINEIWLSFYKDKMFEITLFLDSDIREIIDRLFTDSLTQKKRYSSNYSIMSQFEIDNILMNYEQKIWYNESRKRNHLEEGEYFGYQKPSIVENWNDKVILRGVNVKMNYGVYEMTRTSCNYANRSELNTESLKYEKVYKYKSESIKKSFYIKLNLINFKNTIDSLQVNVSYANYLNELGIVNSAEKFKSSDIRLNKSFNKSDVDINIPSTGSFSENSFALIIGNENYKKEIVVPYAINDATVFKKYLNQTLGFPEKNIRLLVDASYGSIVDEIEWIKNIIKAYKNQATIFIYYAGHGVPNEQSKNAFILPIDGSSSNTRTCIPLDDLMKEITEENARTVTVFIDACFSGDSRNGMLTQARGVKIRPKSIPLTGNLIVFSATSDDETAKPYEEQNHGLFTYFLLKKIQETKGFVSYEELYNYLTTNVMKQSLVLHNKKQTPQINAGSNIQNNWKNLRLR